MDGSSRFIQLAGLIVLCGGVILSPFPASALDVYFGGFAFIGESQSIPTSYRYTSRLLTPETSPSVLDAALAERIANVSNPGFTLVSDRLGTLGPDSKSSLALSFALDRETTSVENIAGLYKIVVDLSAQALFFDFKERALVGSYPVTVEFIDTFRRRPSDADVQQIVQALYTGKSGVNIFDEFAKTVSGITLNPSPTCRLQVTEVGIEDPARSFLPDYLSANESILKTSVAQDFSKYLSVNQRIGVLPYITGQAIGNKMATRFADGTVFNLKVPEPDYTIALDLANFKKVAFASSAAGSSYIYGAYLGVVMKEPLSGAVYFNATIKNGATKIVPAGQATVDDWPAFEESLLGLMDKFTKSLSAPTADWAEKYAGNKSTANDMEKLEKVISKCR